MKMIRVAAVAFACALASPAYAAKCYIREYNAIAAPRGTPAQIAQEPGIADQVTPDFSSGAVQSSAFNAQTTLIELWCDTQASYLVGNNPTAANTNMPLAAQTSKFIGVPIGGLYKLSVHSNP